MIYILYGVSGSGKTTVGKTLARALGIPFYDADDFHPASNIEKMHAGTALVDKDRWPWLEILCGNLRQWETSGGAVLGCSALKEIYRSKLRASYAPIQWILLHGSKQLVAERLSGRPDHFFNSILQDSQFDTLEVPEYGQRFDIITPVDEIVRTILHPGATRHTMQPDIGIIGLGVMGANLAVNFAEHGYHVAVYNRHVPGQEENIAKDLVARNTTLTMSGFDDLGAFISSLSQPRNVLLVVTAGPATDAVISALLPMLDQGDVLIDGGNAHFKDTARRSARLEEAGIHFVGMGVSGGAKGARYGPSMMPGGSKTGYDLVRPMLEKAAAKDRDDRPCCAYIGPGGAGHYVKTVHNGIEYAEMQLIAEVCKLLLGHGHTVEDLPRIMASWSATGLDSYLLQITIDIVQKKEGEAFLVDKIIDIASHKGTGVWTTEHALELGTPAPTIASALAARQISTLRTVRQALNAKYQKEQSAHPPGDYASRFRDAYAAARIINHIIGFELMRHASVVYGFDLDLSEVARVWSNGCILRSTLMHVLIPILGTSNEHLLLHPDIERELTPLCTALRQTAAMGLERGHAMHTFGAAANYLNAMTSRSTANLIQAQRDYFGQHGFERVDGEEGATYHGDW